ncbi:MAG: tetratricopeptide repeat protein [Firmicutes bacterium]|nr:tetratricopeptide repeat protein [Bacillota bacterium]
MMQGKKTTSKVIPFLKNAGYYYQKGNRYYQQNKLEKALLFFKKTIEVEPENSLNHYNLACLLSRMGHLDKANQIFSYIVCQMDPTLTECYFLMAVNYGLMDDLEKARHYLNLYLQISPDGEMVVDAEDLLYALSEEEEEEEEEKRELPVWSKKERPLAGKSKEVEETLQDYQENKAVQRLLWQSLYQKNEQVVEKAIRMYGMMPEEIGEKALKEFVRNPWVRQRLRLQALLELKNMGIRGTVTVFMEGYLREIDLLYYPLVAPRWLGKWQDVLDCTLVNMRSSKAYSERFYEDAQAIWIDFINNIYPRVPTIKKIETWAAGLEYATAKFHFLSVTQHKLAQQYNISPSSVSARYKEINKVLNLEHRAYHNMLMYLTQREKE